MVSCFQRTSLSPTKWFLTQNSLEAIQETLLLNLLLPDQGFSPDDDGDNGDDGDDDDSYGDGYKSQKPVQVRPDQDYLIEGETEG